MNAKLAKKIQLQWKIIEESEPDISTERLVAMTAQYCNCDSADVCEAIEPGKWGNPK